jgi:hypothetical protein
MQAVALLVLLVGAPSIANAQVSGYLYRGSGPPVASTSLTPPAGSPYQAPAGAPSQAPGPAPASGALPVLSQSLGTYTKDGYAALGQCYCTPVRFLSRPSLAGPPRRLHWKD